MLTYTGKNPSLLNMNINDIDIMDIANGLSIENRFNGQTFVPYSVAQHSICIAELLPKDQKLAGLLHDASEAYVKDIPWELKPLIASLYKPIEKRIQKLIYKKYGVKNINHKLIKEFDNSMAWYETVSLFKKENLNWFEYYNKYKINKNLNIVIKPMDFKSSRKKFLDYFYLLTKERGYL